MRNSIIILFLFLFTSSAFPQKDKDWKWQDQDWIDYFKNGKPTVELLYGQSHLSLKNSGIDFNSPGYLGFGLIELKLGYSYARRSVYSKSIIQFRNTLIHGSFISSNFRITNATERSSPILRFGVQSATGYGYIINRNTSLILYNSDGLTWTRYKDNGNGIMLMIIPEQIYYPYDYLPDYSGHIRFGSTTESGIRVPIGTIVNFNLSFDRTLVFPRHLVWKYLGSTLLVEALSHSLIDNFVRVIMRSSPGAGPVVGFLLKTGLSYGIYELRREKMNWPFESTEPLLFDSFKAGVSFTF